MEDRLCPIDPLPVKIEVVKEQIGNEGVKKIGMEKTRPKMRARRVPGGLVWL